MNPARRAALIAAGCFPFTIGAFQQALAMGRVPVTQGINTIKGDVRVNDRPATVGQNLRTGDSIATGADSETLYVIGDSAFFLRARSRVTVESALSGKIAMRLLSGALASVFGKGEHVLGAPTATVGVRGTAVYLDTTIQDSLYFCLCYGGASLSQDARPGDAYDFTTRHHDQPMFLDRDGTRRPAGAINHTDTELIFLESVFGREPPFMGTPGLQLYR